MDIHHLENNLGESNNSCENTQNIESNLHENPDEMNPYAVNDIGIHSHEVHDNIVIDIEEKELENQQSNLANEYFKAKLINTIISNHNKQIRAKQLLDNRRNGIMRSITIHQRNSKSKVKQMISAGKSNGNANNNFPTHRLHVLRHKSKIIPHKKDNLVTNHSIGNFIRDTPPVNDIGFEKQTPHIISENFQLRADPVNPSLVVGPWMASSITPDNLRYKSIPPVVEKPKEINLAEILTGVLQEVLLGNLSSVENIIGKLRVDFEEKNVFTNSKKRNIILLNFEDDTMRPVLKIDEKYMKIIEQWYTDCDLLIDIEETNVSVPEVITTQDVSGVLFQDINYKFKDEYLNSYIPLVINNIISQRTIKCFEKKYFNKTSTIIHQYPIEIKNYNNFVEQKNYAIIGDNILSDMGVIIPENIKPETLKPNNENIPNSKNIYKIDAPWNLPDANKRVDPEIILKKHILADVRKADNSEMDEILPYNSVYISLDTINSSKDEPMVPVSYNSEYNTLYTNFGDNCCLIYDNIDYEKTIKENNISSIFVLINDKFLQTLTIENPNSDMLHIIKNHSEFGFIKLFGITTNNKDIVNFIEREFNKVHFNDIDEVNKKLIVTSQYIEFSNKHNDSNNIASSEENQVKKFIHGKYTIDDDINHKMKASTLYDIIINSKVIKIDNDKISGFRTRLSKYLKEIGLQKKRYNDGFYYYGIVEKVNKFFAHSSTRDHKNNITLNEIQKQRNDEMINFTYGAYNDKEPPLGLTREQIKQFNVKHLGIPI